MFTPLRLLEGEEGDVVVHDRSDEVDVPARRHQRRHQHRPVASAGEPQTHKHAYSHLEGTSGDVFNVSVTTMRHKAWRNQLWRWNVDVPLGRQDVNLKLKHDMTEYRRQNYLYNTIKASKIFHNKILIKKGTLHTANNVFFEL